MPETDGGSMVRVPSRVPACSPGVVPGCCDAGPGGRGATARLCWPAGVRRSRWRGALLVARLRLPVSRLRLSACDGVRAVLRATRACVLVVLVRLSHLLLLSFILCT